MEDPDNAVDEMQQLTDVHDRFYDFLFQYSEFRQPHDGADDNHAERDFLYRYVAVASSMRSVACWCILTRGNVPF